jgi:hypothetical protein
MRLVASCLSLITLLLAIGCATPTQTTKFATEQELKHESVVTFPGITKQVAFDRAMKWIANNFKSAKSVIEYQDKESGSIVGNGTIPAGQLSFLWIKEPVRLTFTMNVDIRDSKMRIKFRNLAIIVGTGDPSPLPNDGPAHRAAQGKFDVIVRDLTDFISSNDEF